MISRSVWLRDTRIACVDPPAATMRVRTYFSTSLVGIDVCLDTKTCGTSAIVDDARRRDRAARRAARSTTISIFSSRAFLKGPLRLAAADSGGSAAATSDTLGKQELLSISRLG